MPRAPSRASRRCWTPPLSSRRLVCATRAADVDPRGICRLPRAQRRYGGLDASLYTAISVPGSLRAGEMLRELPERGASGCRCRASAPAARCALKPCASPAGSGGPVLDQVSVEIQPGARSCCAVLRSRQDDIGRSMRRFVDPVPDVPVDRRPLEDLNLADLLALTHRRRRTLPSAVSRVDSR